MTRHPLDGNAIAADAHYGREEPEMRECDKCDGTGMQYYGPDDRWRSCPICDGFGEVPVEPEEPEARERDE